MLSLFRKNKKLKEELELLKEENESLKARLNTIEPEEELVDVIRRTEENGSCKEIYHPAISTDIDSIIIKGSIVAIDEDGSSIYSIDANAYYFDGSIHTIHKDEGNATDIMKNASILTSYMKHTGEYIKSSCN